MAPLLFGFKSKRYEYLLRVRLSVKIILLLFYIIVIYLRIIYLYMIVLFIFHIIVLVIIPQCYEGIIRR